MHAFILRYKMKLEMGHSSKSESSQLSSCIQDNAFFVDPNLNSKGKNLHKKPVAQTGL